MPSPREQQNPNRSRRRTEGMPGGWLWIVILLLGVVVVYIAVGFNGYGTIDYSDFKKLVDEKHVAKVTLRDASNRMVVEIKDKDKLPDTIKKQVRSDRVEVLLWKGDIDSGEVSKFLDKHEIPRKTEPDMTSWIGPVFTFLFTLMLFAAIFFFLILPRFRDPLGSSFLTNYIRSPAKRFDKTKMRTTFEDVADMANAKYELQEIVEFLKNPEKFQKLGAQIPLP